MGHWMEAFMQLLFPAGRDCPLCGGGLERGKRGEVCRSCRRQLAMERRRLAWCPRCAAVTAEKFCAACRRQLPPFRGARAAGLYRGQLRRALQGFKYGGRSYLGRPLGGLLFELWSELPWRHQVQAVTAVPLGRDRLRQRGYNQAELLARQLASSTGLPLWTGVMRRDRETLPQVGLSRHRRWENVREAFEVTKPSLVTDQTILVVDDVFTTGATARSTAGALRRAGARGVFVLTVAAVGRELNSGSHPVTREIPWVSDPGQDYCLELGILRGKSTKEDVL